MEAIIKIYNDSDCSKELEVVNNKYSIHFSFPSTHQMTYYKPVYIKNVGDHMAFITSLSCNNNVDVVIVEQIPAVMLPNEVFNCTLAFPLTVGRNEDVTIELTLKYDNLFNGGGSSG